MDVAFASTRLEKLCKSQKSLRAAYGDRMAKVIMTRLADLEAADKLEVMKLLPGRCHALAANWSGHFAIDLVHPYRLVFRPIDDPLPLRDSGDLDLSLVQKIEIVAIVDYH